MQQHRLLGAGVAVFLVAEINFAVVLGAAHHQYAAGHVPDIRAVGQTCAAGNALLFVGVHHDEHRAALLCGNGAKRQQGTAHLVAACHLHIGGQKALQRVHDEQQRSGLGGKIRQCLILEGKGLAGLAKVVVGGQHQHPVHVGPGRQQTGLEHLAGVVLARKQQHLAGLLRRQRKKAGGLARCHIGNELCLPDALAGAAVGTQQRHFAQRQQLRHQPRHALHGHIGQQAGLRRAALQRKLALLCVRVHGCHKGCGVGLPCLLAGVEPLIDLVIDGGQLHVAGCAAHVVQQVFPCIRVGLVEHYRKGQAAEQLLLGPAGIQHVQKVCAVLNGYSQNTFLLSLWFITGSKTKCCCYKYNSEKTTCQQIVFAQKATASGAKMHRKMGKEKEKAGTFS